MRSFKLSPEWTRRRNGDKMVVRELCPAAPSRWSRIAVGGTGPLCGVWKNAARLSGRCRRDVRRIELLTYGLHTEPSILKKERRAGLCAEGRVCCWDCCLVLHWVNGRREIAASIIYA